MVVGDYARKVFVVMLRGVWIISNSDSLPTGKGARGKQAKAALRFELEEVVAGFNSAAYLITGFKMNLLKEVKKDRDGIRKELKKCKRREAASTVQRQFTAERHSITPVGSAEG
ncbi:hypothetical protein LR48_Vigan03g087100 [Vigna angularis]|uniref:Uncharacterized protein n=1 Tax=Phaseolus angularis TaxID=3914 RepID=A0A0L9U528_PHAAN|nr:hypothetical protein LR48_Vigan03g087100 [Vigna angularis]